MKRKDIKQALKEMPIETVLLVGKSELTPKQREFARQVALGNTGAEAYRRAYNTKAKPHTQGTEASQLKQNPAIAREIQAYEMALEAQKYRSSESLRALVIQSLVNVLIDPSAKQSTKVTAAKVLGTVTEVAAFTERKEITTISGSDAIKSQIMDQLKTLMLGNGATDVTDVDATELLAELSADTAPADDAESVPIENDDGADPTHPVPPAVGEQESHPHVHTILHEVSENIIDPESDADEPSESPPMSLETKTPGGV